MNKHHGGQAPPGLETVPHSRHHHGPFGRLFRNLDSTDYKTKTLEALGATMRDEGEPAPAEGGWRSVEPDPGQGDNPDIPAGYTYLGQFIDHDITFDPASSLLRASDPDALHNFRTPRFDLDSLYGEGPDDEPFLYDQQAEGKVLLGKVGESEELDLPRNSQGRALTGDPRNDENVIVGQLQLLFLRVHNKLADELGFEEARRQLRWHYQYLVINDFLARVAGPEVVDDILGSRTFVHGPGQETNLPKAELCFYGWREEPFMPVEFSVAAYRFGHSMIRPRYDLNAAILDRPIFDLAGQPGGGQDLRGFQPLLAGWTIDWSFFFATASERPQASRLIDIRLAPGLANLPFATEQPNLAVRNLRRGQSLGLPSGEAVARRMGIPPLSADEVGLAELGLSEEIQNELSGRTPLWFYILREAEQRNQGRRLGPVASRIVAETLIGLLAGDPFSYLSVEPNWSPAAEGRVPQQGERFEIADLIRFAQSG
jgi:hypothetical protein